MIEVVATGGMPSDFDNSVFVNCPFDSRYIKLLRPLLFVIIYFGHNPRIATETSDSGENRLSKICGLITSCRYSIHDLSRLRASKANEFYRMNMPFELGIDFGTRLHGPSHLADKRFLILEKKAHDFKIALSDLAGIDIKRHGDNPVEISRAVRDWYYETVGVDESRPEEYHWPSTVWSKFNEFITSLFEDRLAAGVPEEEAKKDVERMPMAEFIDHAKSWVEAPRDLTA
ncbi:MAG: hypothetical protein ACR2GR_05470 [Rhodothermales bacterium]